MDPEVWLNQQNRRTFRRQSTVKDKVIHEKTETMLESGVIARSSATAWSQVLLTPKPNEKWRFCIDFRQLNTASQGKGWPLPRINEMIRRIGDHKPKIFGKMDLTDGYHQMPLHKDSRQHTSFITAHGLYEWNRVPMGLKTAAAYFQETMCTEVLNGLVMHTCEAYIDDVITHAQTEDDFLFRLEEILTRFSDKGITVSGQKCEFGLTEIEILGHLINEKEIKFSDKKLRGVNATVLPKTGKMLQSFLGLANYFREHVRNIHEHEKPLRQLITNYPGSTVIKWLPPAIKAFEALKEAVWKCPSLFFVDGISPVFLHTDACDTGIGAYLFQIKDGVEQPIGFLSKSLSGAELNWSTFEKEGFAIYKALEHFEYILRDIKFTLRTDHRNLLYLNEKASQKVQRWKLAVQQYNFDVEHIPGVDNIVADLYSRLNTIIVSKITRYSVEDHIARSNQLHAYLTC